MLCSWVKYFIALWNSVSIGLINIISALDLTGYIISNSHRHSHALFLTSKLQGLLTCDKMRESFIKHFTDSKCNLRLKQTYHLYNICKDPNKIHKNVLICFLLQKPSMSSYVFIQNKKIRQKNRKSVENKSLMGYKSTKKGIGWC